MNDFPPCAKWARWIGQEIEGTDGRGEWTLFVRENQGFKNCIPILDCAARKITRIWFCKEFTTYSCIEDAIASGQFKSVCVEATQESYESLPLFIRQRAKIYLKVAVPLKVGDHVCVGPTFNDEAFLIGSGIKVVTSDYLADFPC